MENLDKVIGIDQSPIGRTPRSNPATYTGLFNDIRDLFASTQEAKARATARGASASTSSGGRCEACGGDGQLKIEMHFLPDIYVPCEVCKGKRYNRETLEVRYKGKNIADVLDMTVEEALAFFANLPSIGASCRRCATWAWAISSSASPPRRSPAARRSASSWPPSCPRATGKTIYILDEPTTGLHTDDVRKLLEVLQKLVDAATRCSSSSTIWTSSNAPTISSTSAPRAAAAAARSSARHAGGGRPCEASYTGQYLKKVL